MRNVDEHEDNHLDNDIHNGDDNNYGNNNTSGDVSMASVGHYLWSLWFYMEVINLLLILQNIEARQCSMLCLVIHPSVNPSVLILQA